ncbi:MAG TPA: hypothetical protein DDX39_06370 [Bacteroidales bacterium]|nr:MAG: hypothetical protein A2W98_00455 [Bacteroidetes bacterium GWF2_33_38]OFY90227.1 MAG: hypothetical protein A2236_02785 [Bacteroidetes bacterium RIFOXYA2_FULL_33_7]HBF88250.1 hypothetical protein [Bacteroidales bacterium]
MRIWSLHPTYIDSKGLVALWRETLLAKNVLEGKTKGYRNHPQLNRFKQCKRPIDSINQYLSIVYHEASERGYKFDVGKINLNFIPTSISVTKGQLMYEKQHLLNKLKVRDTDKYNKLLNIENVLAHPIFNIVKGEIESWEIL